MSKAFTRESDDAPDHPVLRQSSALPPGAKNYLTPGGARRMQEELEQLVQVERPRLAALGDAGDANRQLLALDERVLRLQDCLHSAVVVPPPAPPHDHVQFGATVTVRDGRGSEERYRIVGVDETDIDRGWVSWLSPIAKTRLNARLGQRVRFKFPSGEEELEIVAITYE
jgi:transcription elongation factor GreB